MNNRNFVVIRGNTGTEENAFGIFFRIRENDIVQDLSSYEFRFTTEDKYLRKTTNDTLGLGDSNTRLEIPITLAESLHYQADTFVNYELESIKDGQHITQLKGCLIFRDGGTFDDV